MKKTNPNTGRLKLITGCMFAGKTDRLIQEINILKTQNKTVLSFKPSIDNRAKNQFYSRTGKTIHAISVTNAAAVRKEILKYEQTTRRPVDVIAFDEVHFFGLDLVPVIEKNLKAAKIIFCSGLDKGFSERELPIVNQLKKIADEIVLLKAKCNLCGHEATKTQRINACKQPVNPTQINPTNLVGNDETYQARCDECYKKI